MSLSLGGFDAAAERLKAALGLTSDTALAEKLGIGRPAFVQRKRRDSLPRDEIDALCEAAKLNPEWVYEGKGEQRLGGVPEMIKTLGDVAQVVRSLSLDEEDARALQELLFNVQTGNRERVLPAVRRLHLVTVPRYDVEASAGPGRVTSIHDEAIVDTLAFKPEYLREIGISHDRLALISVRGDSMADTLQDGDLILVDTSLVERRSPGVYVILMNDTLLVKRLNFRLTGQVEIRSDNKAYPAETMSPGDFDGLHIVGRMVRRVVR